MGTHLRVLRESYPMSTHMTRFRMFSKLFAFLVLWTDGALALEGLKEEVNLQPYFVKAGTGNYLRGFNRVPL